MKNNSISPYEALDALLEGVTGNSCRPEHVLSLADTVIQGVGELSDESRGLFIGCIREQYDDIAQYARTSTVSRVKMVAGKCAETLGNTEDSMNFYLRGFLTGNESCLFDCIDYLMNIHENEKARSFFTYAWEEWYIMMIAKEPIQDTKREFLFQVAVYAFRLDISDLGYELVNMIEGKAIEKDDPKILKYRWIIRTPEEFELAIKPIRDFYIGNENELISIGLLSHAYAYMQSQIAYIEKNHSIDPAVIELWSQQDIGRKFSDEDVDYYYLWLSVISACFYNNARQAEILIHTVESDPRKSAILIEIIRDFPLTNEGDEAYMYSNEVLFEGLLMQLLSAFQGIEYLEIQEMIYKVLEKMSPIQSHESIMSLRTWNYNRLYHLNSFGLSADYHHLVQEANLSLSPIGRRHIVNLVISGHGISAIGKAIEAVYFVMEYLLFYGKVPVIHPEGFRQMRAIGMSNECRFFLRKYYPAEVSQVGI